MPTLVDSRSVNRSPLGARIQRHYIYSPRTSTKPIGRVVRVVGSAPRAYQGATYIGTFVSTIAAEDAIIRAVRNTGNK